MTLIRKLQPLISEPREELGIEYKDWLNLTEKPHKANLARGAIALANHGGGFIVIGFAEQGSELQSHQRPSEIPETTQDAVNNAVLYYATPEFHCGVDFVTHPKTNVRHPVITVPGNLTVPVMSKRDCKENIARNRVYIRKPGPRSEEPQTGEEWRELLNRCVRARKEDMLEAIRSIVSGRVELQNPAPKALDELQTYCNDARKKWERLVAEEPENSPARFPHGFYKMGFFLIGAQPAKSLAEVRDKLASAQKIQLTGWPIFLEISTLKERSSYTYENFVEAWVGHPVPAESIEREPAYCDFWRVSKDGKLYTIRGYCEDGQSLFPDGKRIPVLDETLPVWGIAEGLLFVSRFAETFDEVDEIAIQCCFTGLNGRHLTDINRRRVPLNRHISSTDKITLKWQVTPQQARDNLAEMLHQELSPLYERFNFFELQSDTVQKALTSLIRRDF